MGATGIHDDGEVQPLVGGVGDPADRPTQQLVAPAVSDRCITCEAPLVSDQRYCLNCGERRGKSGLSFESLTSPPPPATASPSRKLPRASAGATLVAGIATLLLAMGVGVLIGHNGNGNNRPTAAVPPQVITVGGGAGTAASTKRHRAGKGRRNTAAIASPKLVISKKVARAATAAAGKVLGGSANLAPPTVTVGGKCSHGGGCQGGKFTGNFFGGG